MSTTAAPPRPAPRPYPRLAAPAGRAGPVHAVPPRVRRGAGRPASLERALPPQPGRRFLPRHRRRLPPRRLAQRRQHLLESPLLGLPRRRPGPAAALRLGVRRRQARQFRHFPRRPGRVRASSPRADAPAAGAGERRRRVRIPAARRLPADRLCAVHRVVLRPHVGRLRLAGPAGVRVRLPSRGRGAARRQEGDDAGAVADVRPAPRPGLSRQGRPPSRRPGLPGGVGLPHRLVPQGGRPRRGRCGRPADRLRWVRGRHVRQGRAPHPGRRFPPQLSLDRQRRARSRLADRRPAPGRPDPPAVAAAVRAPGLRVRRAGRRDVPAVERPAGLVRRPEMALRRAAAAGRRRGVAAGLLLHLPVAPGAAHGGPRRPARRGLAGRRRDAPRPAGGAAARPGLRLPDPAAGPGGLRPVRTGGRGAALPGGLRRPVGGRPAPRRPLPRGEAGRGRPLGVGRDRRPRRGADALDGGSAGRRRGSGRGRRAWTGGPRAGASWRPPRRPRGPHRQLLRLRSARAARVHIAAEVRTADAGAFWAADSERQDEVCEAFRQAGATAVVGNPSPGLGRGWEHIPGTDCAVRMLSRAAP